MGEPFIGREALTAGRLTPYQLRSQFVAIHRDVYVARDTRLTAASRATAAWLWSGRAAVVAGSTRGRTATTPMKSSAVEAASR